jgi:CHC2 zinc finger
MRTPEWNMWVERARAVRIEDETAKRGIRLNGKAGKNERVGPCPKCGGDDRFAINIKKQVFNCRGCRARGGDAIALVQFLDGVDFVHAVEALTGEPPPKANGKERADAGARKVVAGTYPYHYATGEVALVVERIEYRNPDGSFVMKGGKRKKTFHQKRPDPDRPDSWIWDAEGVPPLIFRFLGVLEAIVAGHTIAIVEGEGKAVLLWEWGIPATCCPGGAKKWRAGHSEHLRGADVVLLPDNDAAGREHVDAIARSLAGIAKRVRILELPDLPPKGDVKDWAAAGHTREQLDVLIEQAPDFSTTRDDVDGDMVATVIAGDLPELIINSSDPTATAKDLAALIAERDDFLFNGHAPVRVAAEADCLPRALEITTEMVRVLAHEICIPTKELVARSGDVRVPAPLSKDVAQIYLHGLEGRWGLKPFHGITTAPILSDDGAIRTASGYDARTGLWCHSIPDVAIPAKPTKGEAERALRKVRGFFRTFAFADAARLYDPDLGVEIVDPTRSAGLDESSFLAALLTAVCRQSLDLAPGFLCDAPALSGSGTGKGLLVKAVCVIASGVKPSAFTSGHDAEEFDKRLTSALIDARPAVFLDNFNNKNLSSDILESALTENPSMVRLMGHTKTVPLHTRAFIGITGNAVQIVYDMARRLLNVHLDARMEDPEQRPFQPGFLDRIFAERANLLAAALTIWRWGRQTRPKSGKPLGSYEVWAQWCRDPLLALGMRDPVDRLDEIKAADPKRRALIAVFEQWQTSHGDMLLKAQDLDHEVVNLIPGAITRDGVVSRQKVAGFLATHDGTRVGGYVLTKVPLTKKVAGYKLSYQTEGSS